MPSVFTASESLESSAIATDVVSLTSTDLVFGARQSRQGLHGGAVDVPDVVAPAHGAAPILMMTGTRIRSASCRRSAATQSPD
jgi:hypothetical protein